MSGVVGSALIKSRGRAFVYSRRRRHDLRGVVVSWTQPAGPELLVERLNAIAVRRG